MDVAYDVAGLTVRLLVHSVEGFSAQGFAAGHADEAVDVEHLVHGGAASTLAHHILPTAGTASWVAKTEMRAEHRSTKQSIECFRLQKNTGDRFHFYVCYSEM